MRHEKKKIVKITEELVGFFFASGATDITTNTKIVGDYYRVTFYSDYNPKHRSEMEHLTEYFNHPAGEDYGVEGEYWELVGSGEGGDGTELMVLGMMVSGAEINVTDTHVTLALNIKMHH